MTTLDATGRIVVGTDLSRRADKAVEWAAARAASRGVPLLVVLVLPDVPIPKRSQLFDKMTSLDFLGEVEARGRKRLTEVSEELAAQFPGLTVETELVSGEASFVLAKASKTADMVVVGARGKSAPMTVHALGGVSDAVTSHAHGPVAVITDLTDFHPDGPVVVGIDDAPEALAAIKYAVAEAAARGVPLVGVHAWDNAPMVASGLGLWSLDAASVGASLKEMVETIMAPYLADHPAVQFEARVEAGRPSSVLIKASEEASVIVVGSRGRGGFAGMLLGSTSKEVLREAHSPVVVVRV